MSLGLVSLLAAGELAGGGVLGRAITGYALLYWGARLVIQAACFGKHAPERLRFRVAEAALVVAFLVLTGVYAWASLAR